MKKLLLLLAFTYSLTVTAQNPLVGNWMGAYALDYDDEKFAHFPLPYHLNFTADTMTIHYFEEVPYLNDDIEKIHYDLKKNMIEFHDEGDTFQILVLGLTQDTLAIFGQDFDEGVMVFKKTKTVGDQNLPKIQLNQRSFVMRNSTNKILDTLEFFPGNCMLRYHSENDWKFLNYQILELNNNQFLNLQNDHYSLLQVIGNKKNEIKLLNTLNGSDTLSLVELTKPKKHHLTFSKWNFSCAEKPGVPVKVGFNDTLLISSAEKKDVLSHYYVSYNQKFILTLPDNYKPYRLEDGFIYASHYNLYQYRVKTKDQITLYNHSRGQVPNPFIYGTEFEMRLTRIK